MFSWAKNSFYSLKRIPWKVTWYKAITSPKGVSDQSPRLAFYSILNFEFRWLGNSLKISIRILVRNAADFEILMEDFNNLDQNTGGKL